MRPICWRKVSKTEARISLNNNKLPSANLVPLTPCLILVCYRNNSNQLQCVEKADENTLDAKNHQTFNIATNAILERKVRNWEISPTCDSRPQLINIRATSPIPCLNVQNNNNLQLHQLVHPGLPLLCTR